MRTPIVRLVEGARALRESLKARDAIAAMAAVDFALLAREHRLLREELAGNEDFNALSAEMYEAAAEFLARALAIAERAPALAEPVVTVPGAEA